MSDEEIIGFFRLDKSLYFSILLRRYVTKITTLCRIFLQTCSKHFRPSFDELYVLGVEVLYFSAIHFKADKNATFNTYFINSLQNELIRYYLANYYNDDNRRTISLDSVNIEEGLTYGEIFGMDDELIKGIYFTSEINDTIRDDNLSDEKKAKLSDERIRTIMLEITGENELSKDEIKKLKRRMKYMFNKNVK